MASTGAGATGCGGGDSTAATTGAPWVAAVGAGDGIGGGGSSTAGWSLSTTAPLSPPAPGHNQIPAAITTPSTPTRRTRGRVLPGTTSGPAATSPASPPLAGCP